MMETALTDTDVLSRISSRLQQTDKSLWGKIKDFLKGLVERLKAAYQGMSPDSSIARLARQSIRSSENALNAFADAASDAIVNYNLQGDAANTADAAASTANTASSTVNTAESIASAESSTPAVQKKAAQGNTEQLVKRTEYGQFVAAVNDDILKNTDPAHWSGETKEEAMIAAREALAKFGEIVVYDMTSDQIGLTSVVSTEEMRDGKLLPLTASNYKAVAIGNVLMEAGENQYSVSVYVGKTQAGDNVFCGVRDIRPTQFTVAEGQKNNSQEDVRYSSRAQQDSEYLELAKDPEENVLGLEEMVKSAAVDAGFLYMRNTRREHAPQNSVPWQMFVKDVDAELSNYGKYTYYATDAGAIPIEEVMPKLQEMAEDFYGQTLPEEEINPPDIVDSAGAWDDMDFVQYIWDNYFEGVWDETGKIPAITTDDGLLVLGRDDTRVKSGAPVEYDDSGNVIPLSQRFDTGAEDIRYSLRNTTDGRTAAVVDEDILSNIDLTQWNEDTKKKVQVAAMDALKKFSDGIVVDGITRSVNRTSRKEYTGSKYSEKISKTMPQVYSDKMRAASVADDIVIASTDWARDGKLEHPRTDNFVDFDHGNVLVEVGENQYSAEVVVGITSAGNAVFYDVVDIQPAQFTTIKEELPPNVTTNKSPDAAYESSSTNRVSQPDADVKQNLKYSSRNLEAQNQKLREDVAYLKKLLKIQKQGNKDFTLDRDWVKRQARQLMKDNNAKGDSAELARMLDGVYRYIWTSNDLTLDGMMDAAEEAAQWVYDHQADTPDAYAQEVLGFLKGRRVALSEAQISEAKYQFGNLNAFRSALKGSIILDSKATTTLDQLWQEAASEYPGTFDSTANDGDMPGLLADIVDTMQNSKSAESQEAEYYSDEYVRDIVYSIIRSSEAADENRVVSAADIYKGKIAEIQETVKQTIADYRYQRDVEFKAMKAVYDAERRLIEQAHRKEMKELEDSYKGEAAKASEKFVQLMREYENQGLTREALKRKLSAQAEKLAEAEGNAAVFCLFGFTLFRSRPHRLHTGCSRC